MKKRMIIGFVTLSAAVMLAFQNCSQQQFESEVQATTEELDSAVDMINSGKSLRDSRFIRVCPMISCAAPPEGCRYEQDTRENVKSLCPSSCGRLVCDRQPPIVEQPPIDEAPPIRQPPIVEPPIAPAPPIGMEPPIACPMIACAEQEGCQFAGEPTRDQNGCPLDCGKRVCDTRLIKERPIKFCPAIAIKCVDIAPGPGCRFDYSSTRDKNGCVVGCPTIVCDKTAQETM